MQGSAVRSMLGCVDAVLGPLALAHQRRGGEGLVLLYHRVAPFEDPAYPPLEPDVFDQHCDFIQHQFSVLSLSELMMRFEQGKSLRGCCAITFDDGYRDFLDYAYPLIERYGLPVTHFLIASCVASECLDWTYRLNRLLHALSLSPQQVVEQFLHQVDRLGSKPLQDREDWLMEAESQIETLTTPSASMLQAVDLSKCNADLVHWGSHSLTHAMLGHCERSMVATELRESQRVLTELTGAPIRYLAYPRSSYSSEVIKEAQACGYEGAFAVEQRELSSQSSLYAMPRFDVGAMPKSMLRLELGGVTQTLRRLKSRLRP